MSTHNIDFHDKIIKKIPEISLNICFLLREEFELLPRESKTSSNQPLEMSHHCSSH